MPTKKRIRKVRQRNPAAESGIVPGGERSVVAEVDSCFSRRFGVVQEGQHHPWRLLGLGMLQGVGNFGSFHPGLAWLWGRAS